MGCRPCWGVPKSQRRHFLRVWKGAEGTRPAGALDGVAGVDHRPPSRVLDPASGFCPRPAPVHRAPACPRSPSVRKATCAHTAGRKTTQRSPCGTELRVPWRRATLRSASLPVWGLSSLWGPPRPFQRRADLGFRFFSLPWPGHKALRVSPSVSRVSLGFHLRSALPGLQEAAVRLRL